MRRLHLRWRAIWLPYRLVCRVKGHRWEVWTILLADTAYPGMDPRHMVRCSRCGNAEWRDGIPDRLVKPCVDWTAQW